MSSEDEKHTKGEKKGSNLHQDLLQYQSEYHEYDSTTSSLDLDTKEMEKQLKHTKSNTSYNDVGSSTNDGMPKNKRSKSISKTIKGFVKNRGLSMGGTNRKPSFKDQQQRNSFESIMINKEIDEDCFEDTDDDSKKSLGEKKEEDVCFPIYLEKNNENKTTINFEEMDSFGKGVNEDYLRPRPRSRSRSRSIIPNNTRFLNIPVGYNNNRPLSTAELSSKEKANGVTFDETFRPNKSFNKDRFTYFSTKTNDSIHADLFPDLIKENQSFEDLFDKKNGTWWLDCSNPTDSEIKMISKAFGIHPLTREDIEMQETREKFELFKSYYFVAFHTFDNDKSSNEYLEPITFYMVVFEGFILTFHFGAVSHPSNVRRRIRKLNGYINVTSDWISYAVIDDITDGFAPIIMSMEYEADSMEDHVLVAREIDFKSILNQIGDSRKEIMTLSRLLSGKSDVIKTFIKRYRNELQSGSHGNFNEEIPLYLGDIQDHIATMIQNLLSYEKIFSRSHGNFLSQIQVESLSSNNRVTVMLNQITLIGTILVPLNVITGLFGMNVKVPGGGQSDFHWFIGICVLFIGIVIISLTIGFYWMSKSSVKSEFNKSMTIEDSIEMERNLNKSKKKK